MNPVEAETGTLYRNSKVTQTQIETGHKYMVDQRLTLYGL